MTVTITSFKIALKNQYDILARVLAVAFPASAVLLLTPMRSSDDQLIKNLTIHDLKMDTNTCCGIT